jgi:predicted phage replisome organizer/uncharacterized phage protein (TIGR02220 family)
MAESKKYFWLKLKRDFFKRHDIQIIESMPNGKDYILFYLKLLCESVDHEGNLRFSDEIPYNEQMLATITHTNPDIVKSAIKVFTELHMMEILDDGTLYMSEVNKMLGVSTQDEHTKESTRLRVQRYRDRQKTLPQAEKRYSNVTCNGEIELEIEKELEKDIDKKGRLEEIHEIIGYLNEKTGKKFRASSEAHAKYVRARLKEGYTVEDFKKVIDKKVKKWKDDPKMFDFLRPSTLFAPSHFDEYLNEPDTAPKVVKTTNQFNNFQQRPDDDIDYERFYKLK